MKLNSFVDRNPTRANVPCGTCTLCCRTMLVPLAEEETDYLWAWVEHPKTGERLGRALQRRPDGACVYLGEKGCTIWDRAPHVCQVFSCADVVTRWNRNERRHMVNSGKLPKSLFIRGREILELYEKENQRPVLGRRS